MVLRDIGDSDGAAACWRQVLTLHRPECFASMDEGIYGHLPRRNLGILAEERGDHAEARRLWTGVLAECPNDRDALRALARLDAADAAHDPDAGWLIDGSHRERLPDPPDDAEGDFTAFASIAAAWVRALDDKTILALGVRFGDSTRALLEGARQTEGHVWGIDRLLRHDVEDPRFTHLAEDPALLASRWDAIDLLHVEVDANTGELPRHWLDLYASRCRAIALAGTHHPSFGTSAAARHLATSGDWQVFEYRAGFCGWTVLVRHGPNAAPPSQGVVGEVRGTPGITASGLYLNLLVRSLTDWLYDGRNEPVRAQGLDWPQRAHTMIGLRRLSHLRRCVEIVLAEGIPGDLLEAGVWRGGATILMRGVLQAYNDSDRRVVAADSFRGVPPPDPARYPADAGDRHHHQRALAIPLEDVKENFHRYALLDDRVVFLEGWFRDTLPAAPTERLAVLRLDGDLYESTLVALESLYDRVAPGGFVIVDDYGAIATCRQAMHDFRAARDITDPCAPSTGRPPTGGGPGTDLHAGPCRVGKRGRSPARPTEALRATQIGGSRRALPCLPTLQELRSYRTPQKSLDLHPVIRDIPLKLLFAPPHCPYDSASGAALCTRDTLELLAPRGHDCRILSAGLLDAEHDTPLDAALQAQGIPFTYADAELPGGRVEVLDVEHNGVRATLLPTASSRAERAPTEVAGDVEVKLGFWFFVRLSSVLRRRPPSAG
jgi:O-methyltransferase